MTSQPAATNRSALITLISVFFFWGFVAASNDILIPVFREHFTNMTVVESQLVSFYYYFAYTVGSVLYFLISWWAGSDILNKIGYKNGIAAGLILSAIGTLFFIPAANLSSFGLFLSGLFIVGLGFSLQQTAANPLAIVIGNPLKGSQRLSLAGGVNNFGTTIGPLIVSFAIFGSVTGVHRAVDLGTIKAPYLILGAAFVLVAIVFKFSSIPNKIEVEDTVPAGGANTAVAVSRKYPVSYPQLSLGMVAIFIYVGVEVSTASNLSIYIRDHIKMPTDRIAPYISLYWASLMMGRWASAPGAFDLRPSTMKLLKFVMPYVGFLVFLAVNAIAGHDLTVFYPYAPLPLIMILGDLASKGNPSRQLLLFSGFGIVSLLIGMFTDGAVSIFAFTSVGLFCSTLWPCIFTLAIAGLGKHINRGSAFLIMMIMGGGVISLLQGWIAQLVNIHFSFIVDVACFGYLAFYAVFVKGVLRKQNIDYDIPVAGGH